MKNNSVDWNMVWTDMMQANRRADHQDRGNCATLWDSRENAERFWKRSQENKGRIEKTLNELPLNKDSRVLDIGAGPGSLSIPLSERVAHVTAVEPGKGMMELLQENISNYGINNIDCVNKRWEDPNVEDELKGPYDVVIASFSLGMPDIRDAIEKMQRVCSGHISLYWFAGETPWEAHSANLWPAMYGKEYTPGPKCDVLYNLLYSMGIYPDIHVFPIEYVNPFCSMDEAFDHFSSRYTIDTEQQKSVLRKYLEETLEKQDGQFVDRALSTRVKIWWEQGW
ncbi:class I SAM-dependent methyltransferase [Methanococcoides methylutens]|uniref:class I SAM-dependent methyltransferase n=1 Tax=Methanococcoides methylutens TaxID=2226 RepID=UPI004043BFFE